MYNLGRYDLMHVKRHYGITQIMVRILAVAAVLGLHALPMHATYAQTSKAERQYQIKASFLYHFLQFVEWPDDAFVDNSQEIVVGILGEDPFGAVLDNALAGKTIRGKKLVIRRYTSPGEVACHLLFISASEEDRLPDVLRSLASLHVLTVGETPHFTQQGGTIKLFEFKNKVRFEINLEVARRARLIVSSKLLKLARVV